MQTSIFQTDEWAQFKCKSGYADFYRLDDILVLEKRLPLGRTMLYSPMANQILDSRFSKLEWIKSLGVLAKKTKTIFFRLEIDTSYSESLKSKIKNLDSRFVKSFEEMQPEHTLILDITKSESEILAQMKQKGRYNIKIAERSDMNISWAAKPGIELDDFYNLYEEMAKRQKISYRNKSYFEALLEILGEKGYARVYSASAKIGEKRTSLAAAIISFYNGRATYLFGGSSSENRNLMAPYGLHWQIVKDARGLACTEYDFFGIAPNDDVKHPWAGVTRFKKQFGGNEVHLAGSWDLVFKPVEYQIFKIAEKIRR